MKKILLFMACAAMVACNSSSNDRRTESAPESKSTNTAAREAAKPCVKPITEAEYCSSVFDFAASPDKWEFRGERPCVVDFYAVWCGPCKMIAPLFDSLAGIYSGQVDFYKIDTDQNRQISQFFGINRIPTIMFCNQGGVYVSTGAYDFGTYRSMVDSLLAQ